MKVKTILVSQPRPTSDKSPYFDMEKRYNVRFDFRQFIRVEAVTTREFRDQHIYILDYTAVIFTTKMAVDYFFALSKELRVDIPEQMHYYCTTEQIANYLQKYIEFRKRRVFFGLTNKISELLPMMSRRSGEKYLFVMSDVHNDDAINMLREQGYDVTPAVVYKTVANIFEEEKLTYDMIVLFTPIGVNALKKNFPDFVQGETVLACLGANTAQAIRDAGLRLDIEAPSLQCPSITKAIDDFLKENHKRVR